MSDSTTHQVAPVWSLYPAIDLHQGSCVRLKRGDFDQCTKYNDQPYEQVAIFRQAGARCLHVVDLDGARGDAQHNREVIIEIARRNSDLYIQVGGGVRSEEIITEYFDAGVAAVILGTACLVRPQWVQAMASRYPGRIKIGLDARDGRLAVMGWLKQSTVSAVDAARRFRYPEVAAAVYTDIDKDGTLSGINLSATLQLAQEQPIPVLSSGGVSTIDDLEQLWLNRQHNISGAVIGQALYTGTIDLVEALQTFPTQNAVLPERDPTE